jgi:pimeloyl-ACP methyl ester carboxylesterase
MEERWFDVRTDRGVRLRARSVGDGPIDLVLHHGLASSQQIWDLMIPRLVGRCRVVTFDARGHGRSAKPSSGYGFATTTADLVAVVRAARLRRPIVAGHSWGAMVALEAVVRHPRTFAGAYLVDGGVTALSRDMTWAEAKIRLAPPHLDGMPVDAFRAAIPSFWDGAVRVTPEIEAMVLSLMRVDRDGGIHPRLHRSNHLRILRAIWEQDPLGLHARLRVPAEALLTQGGGSAEAAWTAAKRRQARTIRATGAPTHLVWVEGIHDIPLQQPALVARRIGSFARRAVG